VHKPRPRLARAIYLGRQRYFLTFCTASRQQLFTEERSVAIVLDQILHVSRLAGFAVPAYCFMPDHLHLLVEGATDTADLLGFVHQAKQRSAFRFKARFGTRLWQPSFYDRVLREQDDARAVARYILENPVRGGLAREPGDYPFSGSDTATLVDLIEWAFAPRLGTWRPP